MADWGTYLPLQLRLQMTCSLDSNEYLALIKKCPKYKMWTMSSFTSESDIYDVSYIVPEIVN